MKGILTINYVLQIFITDSETNRSLSHEVAGYTTAISTQNPMWKDDNCRPNSGPPRDESCNVGRVFTPTHQYVEQPHR